MGEFADKYGSWLVKGTYLNHMLHCGRTYNVCVQNALEYLPVEVFEKMKTSVAFLSTCEVDGCRLARELCENREIILLSERIFPRRGATEGDDKYRYFIFVVLHEFTHAYLRHRSPMFDSLDAEENEAQEIEADELALKWFNDYISKKANPYFVELTQDELTKAKKKSAEEVKAIYRGEN